MVKNIKPPNEKRQKMLIQLMTLYLPKTNRGPKFAALFEAYVIYGPRSFHWIEMVLILGYKLNLDDPFHLYFWQGNHPIDDLWEQHLERIEEDKENNCDDE